MTQFNEDVQIIGNANEVQLLVKGHTTQTEPLQVWQNAAGTTLAELVEDGRLRVGGDLTMGTPSALLEANQQLASSETVKQGWQSRGEISGAVSEALAWIVHELELEGSGGISSLVSALRTQLTHSNTGNAAQADLRAGEFQVINQAGTSVTPVAQAAAVSGMVSNEANKYLAKAIGILTRVTNELGGDIAEAIGLKVEDAINDGTIDVQYGLKIADLLEGVLNYAIYTGKGLVHFGDVVELGLPTVLPTDAPDQMVRLYPKSDGKLYAMNWNSQEYDLTSSGGSAAAANKLVVEGIAGEALAINDYAYLNEDNNRWYQVDVDDPAIKIGLQRGVVITAAAQNSVISVVVEGEVDSFSGLTPGRALYAAATPGGLTHTAPTVSAGGSQQIMVRAGVALDSTTLFVLPNRLDVLKRAVIADGASLTLAHPADPQARRRICKAYGSTNGTGSSLTAHIISQTSGVALKGQAGAGGTSSASTTDGVTSIGDVGGPDRWCAQSFQVTAGNLSEVKFRLGSNAGTPQGTLTWRIETDNNDKPSGTLVGNATGTLTPTANAVNTIPVTDGPFLEANTRYWLVLKSTTPQETTSGRGWNWYRSNASQYANGKRGFTENDGSSWTMNSTSDHDFSITTIATTANTRLAQSFQIGSASAIDSVKLRLKKLGTPTGNLALKIYSDTSGAPGSLVANGTSAVVAASSLGSDYGWVTFTFLPQPSLNASTTYWLVLESTDSASAINYVVWGADNATPAYANGELKSEQAGSWVAESKDARFEVFAPGTAFDEPLVVGRFSGGSRDIAVRYDDGSGANADTKTTFKNMTGASLDVTCVVELGG